MPDQGNPSGCGGSCPTPPSQLQLYQPIIFVTPVLFAFMLLLLFCLLYLWRRHGASVHSPMRGQFFAGLLLATPPLEHGLSKSFRQRLPIMPYDENFSSTCQDTQCAVCLGDYQPDEKIQQLPACNHSFHVQCIDEWLAKNATCPICRTSLLMEEGGGGLVDGVQCQDGSGGMEPSIRGDEHRLWEGRVTSQVQDQGFLIRIDASNGASSSGVPSSESSGGGRPAGEPPVNMERI